MKNDHSWRGMVIKDNEGDWGVCVAAWRGMKKGKPGIPGMYFFSMIFLLGRSYLEKHGQITFFQMDGPNMLKLRA